MSTEYIVTNGYGKFLIGDHLVFCDDGTVNYPGGWIAAEDAPILLDGVEMLPVPEKLRNIDMEMSYDEEIAVRQLLIELRSNKYSDEENLDFGFQYSK
jgi:hypothetical protein